MLRKEDEIRPKGSRVQQAVYFINAEMYMLSADGGCLRSGDLKRTALIRKAMGLILQNPRVEDLKRMSGND